MSTIGLVSCSQCLRRVHRFAALKFQPSGNNPFRIRIYRNMMLDSTIRVS